MTSSNRPQSGTAVEQLTIERVLDAPRELVWKAFTEEEHFKQWWGPRGFTVPFVRIDFKPGGKMHYCMRWPEGQGEDIWSGMEYREIVPYERIVYVDYFADEQGNKVSPERYGMGADFPEETVNTLTLEDLGGGKTKLVMYTTLSKEAADQTGATEGWNETIDKLAEYLATF